MNVRKWLIKKLTFDFNEKKFWKHELLASLVDQRECVGLEMTDNSDNCCYFQFVIVLIDLCLLENNIHLVASFMKVFRHAIGTQQFRFSFQIQTISIEARQNSLGIIRSNLQEKSSIELSI